MAYLVINKNDDKDIDANGMYLFKKKQMFFDMNNWDEKNNLPVVLTIESVITDNGIKSKRPSKIKRFGKRSTIQFYSSVHKSIEHRDFFEFENELVRGGRYKRIVNKK